MKIDNIIEEVKENLADLKKVRRKLRKQKEKHKDRISDLEKNLSLIERKEKRRNEEITELEEEIKQYEEERRRKQSQKKGVRYLFLDLSELNKHCTDNVMCVRM